MRTLNFASAETFAVLYAAHISSPPATDWDELDAILTVTKKFKAVSSEQQTQGGLVKRVPSPVCVVTLEEDEFEKLTEALGHYVTIAHRAAHEGIRAARDFLRAVEKE